MRQHTVEITLFLLMAFLSSNARAKVSAVEANATDEILVAGEMTLRGEYEYFEDGDLCFVADLTSSKKIPKTFGPARVCFANVQQALSEFDLNHAVLSVDLKKTCGLRGHAVIRVANIVSNEGPSRRWYTAQLKTVLKKATHKLVACNG
ncbi:MAG: hypothetical protein V4582_24965 [Pseudomonadota bacterium]